MIDRNLNYGRHVIDEFAARLTASAPERVLDIGAGSGTDLAICKGRIPGASFHAIEAHPPNVALLQQQGVSVAALDLEKDRFPSADQTFDLIVANQILEHCKELFWIFHEVSRTLKVGGHLLVGVPNLASLHSRLLLLTGRQPTCIHSAGPHVRGFTKADLQHFLQSCAPGLYSLEFFRGSNFYPFPPTVAKPLARWFPGAAAVIFLGLRKNAPYRGQSPGLPGRAGNQFLAR